MNRISTLLAAAVVVLAIGGVGHANLIVNGSFETGANPPGDGFRTLTALNTDLTGWTVTAGSIDWIGGYWEASDGDRSIDLGGLEAGTIVGQVFATTPGQWYALTFDMAANPDNNHQPNPKKLQVTVSGTNPTIEDFLFTPTSTTKTDMGWQTKTLLFEASDAATSLQFADLTGGAFGAALDNVSVVAIPEPATLAIWSLFGAGAAAVGAIRRRRPGRWSDADRRAIHNVIDRHGV